MAPDSIVRSHRVVSSSGVDTHMREVGEVKTHIEVALEVANPQPVLVQDRSLPLSSSLTVRMLLVYPAWMQRLVNSA